MFKVMMSKCHEILLIYILSRKSLETKIITGIDLHVVAFTTFCLLHADRGTSTSTMAVASFHTAWERGYDCSCTHADVDVCMQDASMRTPASFSNRHREIQTYTWKHKGVHTSTNVCY